MFVGCVKMSIKILRATPSKNRKKTTVGGRETEMNNTLNIHQNPRTQHCHPSDSKSGEKQSGGRCSGRFEKRVAHKPFATHVLCRTHTDGHAQSGSWGLALSPPMYTTFLLFLIRSVTQLFCVKAAAAWYNVYRRQHVKRL